MSSSRLTKVASRLRTCTRALPVSTSTRVPVVATAIARVVTPASASSRSSIVHATAADVVTWRRSLSFWRTGDAKKEDTSEAPKEAAAAGAATDAAPASETVVDASSTSTATPATPTPSAADVKPKETKDAPKAKVNGNGNGNGNGTAAAGEKKKEEKSAGEIAREKEIVALQEKLKAKDILLSQLNDQWRSAVAEQDNVRRRAQIDMANSKKFGIEGFAKSLLEVADTLIMAAASVEKEIQAGEADAAIRDSPQFQTLRQLYDGVALTDKVLNKAFERNHVIRYDPMGAKFDPNVHEGIYQFDDATKPPGTVAAVMKVGYMLHDRVLRPATVATIKGVYVAPASTTPEAAPSSNGSPSGAQS